MIFLDEYIKDNIHNINQYVAQIIDNDKQDKENIRSKTYYDKLLDDRYFKIENYIKSPKSQNILKNIAIDFLKMVINKDIEFVASGYEIEYNAYDNTFTLHDQQIEPSTAANIVLKGVLLYIALKIKNETNKTEMINTIKNQPPLS